MRFSWNGLRIRRYFHYGRKMMMIRFLHFHISTLSLAYYICFVLLFRSHTSRALLDSSSDWSALLVVCFIWCSDNKELQSKFCNSISNIDAFPSLSHKLISWFSQGCAATELLLPPSMDSCTPTLQKSPEVYQIS